MMLLRNGDSILICSSPHKFNETNPRDTTPQSKTCSFGCYEIAAGRLFDRDTLATIFAETATNDQSAYMKQSHLQKIFTVVVSRYWLLEFVIFKVRTRLISSTALIVWILTPTRTSIFWCLTCGAMCRLYNRFVSKVLISCVKTGSMSAISCPFGTASNASAAFGMHLKRWTNN